MSLQLLHFHFKLTDALRFERNDVWTVVMFAVAVGVLSIVTPAAIEALVPTTAPLDNEEAGT